MEVNWFSDFLAGRDIWVPELSRVDLVFGGFHAGAQRL